MCYQKYDPVYKQNVNTWSDIFCAMCEWFESLLIVVFRIYIVGVTLMLNICAKLVISCHLCFIEQFCITQLLTIFSLLCLINLMFFRYYVLILPVQAPFYYWPLHCSEYLSFCSPHVHFSTGLCCKTRQSLLIFRQDPYHNYFSTFLAYLEIYCVCQKPGHKGYACLQKKIVMGCRKRTTLKVEERIKESYLVQQRRTWEGGLLGPSLKEAKRPASYHSHVDQQHFHVDIAENSDNIEYVMSTIGHVDNGCGNMEICMWPIWTWTYMLM